ncbi:MAG: hypothetical protein ACKOWL_02490 [Sphingobacteriaceae bacterium]
MKTPNKKGATKSTDVKKNSVSKKATPKPPLGFVAGDEDDDFDLSLNDDLQLDGLDSLDDDDEDF